MVVRFEFVEKCSCRSRGWEIFIRFVFGRMSRIWFGEEGGRECFNRGNSRYGGLEF